MFNGFMVKRVHKYTSTVAYMRQNTNSIFLVVFVVASVVLMNISQSRLMNNIRDAVGYGVVYGLQIINQPQIISQHLGEKFTNFWAVYQENERLKAQNIELSLYRQKYYETLAMQKALQNSQHYKPAPDKNFISARVIGDSPYNNKSLWLIDAGKNQGVAEKSVALTPNGVVGIVTKVGANNAQILRLNDHNAHVPIGIANKNLRAIMRGTGGKGAELIHLDGQDTPEIGDEIMTSGHGGLFPPFTPVGRVMDINNNIFQVQLYAESEPPLMVRVMHFGALE